MRHLDWIKRIEAKSIFHSQLLGLTAISLIGVAVLLYVFFTYGLMPDWMAEKAAREVGQGTVPVELEIDSPIKGIYFVSPDTKVQDFLANLGIERPLKGNVGQEVLRAGMKVSIGRQQEVVIGEMEAKKCLALDLPLDVNRASAYDLMLIPGLGEKTAQAIVAFREQKGGKFNNLDELNQIPGIKEKRLASLRKYLYCKTD